MSESTNHSAAAAAPAPSHELRRLQPLVGHWTVEGYAQESLAGPAGPVKSRESFEWLDGRYFLIHRYETHFGDQPMQRGVMYWGYDDARPGLLLHFFSNNGPFTMAGNVYEGQIRAGAIVCTGPARFTIGLDEHGTIAVGADGSFEIAWELRDAAGAWRPWMRDRYVRAR